MFVYCGAQVVGAVAGAVTANLMYELPAITLSTTERSSTSLWLAEVVAAFGLVIVVFGVVRSKRTSVVPFAVAGYITAAYFFTSSTSFANPAVTLGRTMSDTFAGIDPSDAPAFILFQLIGGLIGLAVIKVLYPPCSERDEVVTPHDPLEPKRDAHV